MINEGNIFQKGMLIAVKARTYTGRKKLTEEQLKDLPTEIVRGVHDLFDKDFKVKLQEVSSLDNKARGIVKRKSVPFPIDGVYFVPFSKIDEIVQLLEEKKTQKQEMVNELLEGYEEAIKVFSVKYPEYYRETSYPSKVVLASEFSFGYQFIKINAPDKNPLISPEQYKKEIEKFKESIEEMKKDVVGIIYQNLLEVTEKLKKQCAGDKLNPRTFGSLSKFMNLIDEVYADFVDREDLNKAIKNIKAQVLGVTADSIGDSKDAKSKFEKQLKAITSELRALPDIPLKRAIEF